MLANTHPLGPHPYLSNTAPPMIVITGSEEFIDSLCITSHTVRDTVQLQFQCTALVPDIIVLQEKYEHKSTSQLFDMIIKIWQRKENIKFLFENSVTKPTVNVSRLRDDGTTVIDESSDGPYSNTRITYSQTYLVHVMFEITEQDYVYYTLKYK